MTDDNPAGASRDAPTGGRDAAMDDRIVLLRDAGASWLEIQQQFELTRQQARYAYQRGKREERRSQRRITE